MSLKGFKAFQDALIEFLSGRRSGEKKNLPEAVVAGKGEDKGEKKGQRHSREHRSREKILVGVR